MDIVYILGKGSKWRDNELRYSLRSIEDHLTDYDKVFIVGELPAFLNTNVIHIPADDLYGHERNIMEKIKVACKNQYVSDDFFFINDDHFLLQAVKSSIYPYYSKGLLLDYINDREFDDYRQALENTFNALINRRLSSYNYDIHTPIVYNKKKFIKVMDSYDWENNEYVIKSLYCNTLGVTPVFIEDCKINKKLSIEQIEEKTKGHHCFSISDHAIHQGVHYFSKSKMRVFLKLTYPNKSKYEQTGETNEDVKSSND